MVVICWEYLERPFQRIFITNNNPNQATVVRDRYVLLLGSTHGKNSFRVEVDRGPGPPDMSLARDSGIVTYYGDSMLCYDTATGKYSRVACLGVITAHWGSNGTHVIGVGVVWRFVLQRCAAAQLNFKSGAGIPAGGFCLATPCLGTHL